MHLHGPRRAQILARMPHMFKRKKLNKRDASTYWFRFKLPSDLRAMPVPRDWPQALALLVSTSRAGHLKNEVKRSLGASDAKVAKRRAALRLPKWKPFANTPRPRCWRVASVRWRRLSPAPTGHCRQTDSGDPRSLASHRDAPNIVGRSEPQLRPPSVIPCPAPS